MFNFSSLFLLVIAIFVIGVTAGYYNGAELDYSKIQLSREYNNSSSPIIKPVYMMVDGGIMLLLELSKLVANQMIDKGIDFNSFLKVLPYLFYGLVAIIVLPAITKLFLYVYILVRELKEAKRDKLELKRLKEAKGKWHSNKNVYLK